MLTFWGNLGAYYSYNQCAGGLPDRTKDKGGCLSSASGSVPVALLVLRSVAFMSASPRTWEISRNMAEQLFAYRDYPGCVPGLIPGSVCRELITEIVLDADGRAVRGLFDAIELMSR